MMTRRILIQKSIFAGARKGLNGFVWMMKILIPISLLTSVLLWSGWLAKGEFFIQPVMKWLSLPAAAALPLLIGTLTGPYGAIAAMAVLPLSKEHMTLIAVFILIAHALIQEGAVQGKSGLHPLKASIYRLIAATLAVLVIAPFLDISAYVPLDGVNSQMGTQTFGAMLLSWLQITAFLALKMFLIIMCVLMLLEILKNLGWMNQIVRICRPILKTLGLSEKSGAIWMTSAVFGLLYGAAVIVEETKEGHLDEKEQKRLHLSIGINHAVFEDPAIFMTLGLNPFFLWVPRLSMAILAVRIFDLWQYIKKKHHKRSVHTATSVHSDLLTK